MDSVCMWKGSYFHEVVFSWKNRGKLLYATAAMALDIEKTTLNDWERFLEYGRGGVRGRGQGFDFNYKHHNNRRANKTQKDLTLRLIVNEFFSVSGSPSRALLVYHWWVSFMQDKWMAINWRVVEEIALVYVITLKNIFDFLIFHDKNLSYTYM